MNIVNIHASHGTVLTYIIPPSLTNTFITNYDTELLYSWLYLL
jgi:hypothetical protein